MPVQYLGAIPAQKNPLTELLKGLVGGLQTGMGYYQQAQEQQYKQSVLDFEMEKQGNEEFVKYAETMYGMWEKSDEPTKSMIEEQIRANPTTVSRLEGLGYWWGGPEGGFAAISPDPKDLPTYKATKLGDSVLLYNEKDPEDTVIIPPEEKKWELEWVEGETGYFAPKLEDGTLGETVYVGPEKDASDIHVYKQAYGLIYIDESDPNNPVVVKQVLKPTDVKTSAELLKDRNTKIKEAQTAVFNFLRIKYPESWTDIMDEKARVRIGSQMALDYRERFKEELTIRGFSETDATKISGGVPFPMDILEVYAGWVAAKGRPDRRTDIEMMIKANPLLLADAEAHPEVWDAELGGFLEPVEELNILEQLLAPERMVGERPIDKWMGLDEVEFGEVVPPEPKAKKEKVLYTDEINAEVAKDKKYAEENPGSLKAMQRALKEQGYWDYSITGKWTATFEKALRKFYRDQLKE